MFKKMAIVLGIALAVSACSNDEQIEQVAKTSPKKEKIVVGFGAGTYITQFEKGVRPYLEKKGYEIETKTFSHNKLIPQALKEDAVDASVHISTANMGEMNRRLQADMIVWADTPSAPQSLRSIKHTSLDVVKDGMTVGLPNDPINLERAVRILEDLDWVTVDPNVETVVFSTNAVSPKKFDLVFKPMDAAQLPRAMDDLDFAVINGNFIASKGERISDGLAIEKSPPEHLVKVAIRDVNKNEQWAKDLQEAYQSKEFETYIKGERLFDGFIYPKHWD